MATKKKKMSYAGDLLNPKGEQVKDADYENVMKTSKQGSANSRKSLGMGRLTLSELNVNVQEADNDGPNNLSNSISSRRKSMVTNLGASPATKNRPSLSDPQLSDLYSECIKLATANKVNQQNAWSLHLIDYMDEVISKANELKDVAEDEDEEGGYSGAGMMPNRHYAGSQQMNFQKASCTLDASVMIYSHRVDSVHKDTFKVLGSFSRGGGETGMVPDEGADENGEIKKKTKQRYVSTIETNMANLNVKIFELESQTDPVFKKTSASFDQGGAKGLLFNNLSTYDGCKIAFDSDIIPDGNYKMYFDGDQEEDDKLHKQRVSRALEVEKVASEVSMHLDLSDLWVGMGSFYGLEPTKPNLLAIVNQSHICPALADFYAIIANSGTQLDVLDEKNKMDSDDDDADAMVDEVCDDNGNELDLALEEEEQRVLDMQHAQPEFSLSPARGNMLPKPLAARPARCTPPPSALPYQKIDEFGEDDDGATNQQSDFTMPLVFSDQAEEFAFIDRDILKNWAGASHWKFQAPKTAKSGTVKSTLAEPGVKKQKVAFRINFFDQHSIPEAAFGKPSSRLTNIVPIATLLKADASKFLLPTDLKLGTKDLQQLFLKPAIFLRVPTQAKKDILSSAQKQSAPSALQLAISAVPNMNEDFDHHGQDAHCDVSGDDDPGEHETCGMADVSMSGENLDLVAEPTKVEKIEINFAKFAKKVDVRELKASLWSGIKSKKAVKQEPTSFQTAINTLQKSLPSEAVQNVSVPYCFICLLHLCNENNLSLVAKPPATDKAKGSTNFVSPVDAGFSLADFDIIRNDA